MRIMTVGPTGVVAMQRVLNWMAASNEQVWVSDYANQHPELLPGTFDFYPLLPIRRMGGALRRARLGKLADRIEASRMHALASKVQPDVVHVHSIDIRGLACARAGIGPLLVSAWGGLSQAVAQPERPFARMTQQILSASDAVLVDAPTLLEPAAHWVKVGGQVVHLPMGADTQAFRPGRTGLALEWRAHFAIPDDTFVLLSPRMWAPYYRHQDVLRAYVLGFPRFQRPTQLAFTCLGRGPQELPHMAEVWQEVADTAAAASILWLPRIRYGQMPTLYAMGDAVVNYPAMDSFGATLVEAAACQVPLITPLLPTYRGTFVEDFATLVAQESIEALADAMVHVVNEAPEERYARLSQARAIVEREYDDAVIQERLWRLYADLAKR
ncbi:MAG: glycosyltransferase family 4 protein [Anaerolineae bacterium]